MSIKQCRICESNKLVSFFNLGRQPLANSLLKSPDEHENYYPLALKWCKNCKLVQLSETVNPEILFANYFWVTATSRIANTFADLFCEELIKRTEYPRNGYVLEVGSNDGTFLIPFKKKGYAVLGIDPAKNISDIANANGILTKSIFFKSLSAKHLVAKRGKAKMVFARNVLPHVSDTRDFVKGLAISLAPDGVLAIEAHYAKAIQDDLHYDSIYHEHLCYFTLKTLSYLLEQFGLKIFDAFIGPINGGNLIVYAAKEKRTATKAVKKYLDKEKSTATNSFNNWRQFAKKSLNHNRKFLKILKDNNIAGKTIVGWGASARSSTLLNYCNINKSLITMIADKNPLKQGLFTAGTHLPILHPDLVFKDKPDIVVILAWNFAKEIVEELKSRYNYHGLCIIPLPKVVRIIKI
jgi:SAM-dependent methyltransferase